MWKVFLLLFAVDVGFAPTSVFAGFISNWNAPSGVLPNQIATPWTLFEDATPELPVLSGGVLTLSTTPDAERMIYSHSGSTVDMSGNFYIEARLKRVSGSTSSPNRAPISIGFTTTGSFGNILFIGNDEVFFINSGDVKGPTASVQTDDAFHTYRIEVSSIGGITLLRDNMAILSASTINNVGLNGSVPIVFWGDGTLLAQGVSEWQSFEHNVLAAPAAIPEPSSLALLGFGALSMLGYRVRTRRRTEMLE
jgi:hypothetical protein